MASSTTTTLEHQPSNSSSVCLLTVTMTTRSATQTTTTSNEYPYRMMRTGSYSDFELNLDDGDDDDVEEQLLEEPLHNEDDEVATNSREVFVNDEVSTNNKNDDDNHHGSTEVAFDESTMSESIGLDTILLLPRCGSLSSSSSSSSALPPPLPLPSERSSGWRFLKPSQSSSQRGGHKSIMTSWVFGVAFFLLAMVLGSTITAIALALRAKENNEPEDESLSNLRYQNTIHNPDNTRISPTASDQFSSTATTISQRSSTSSITTFP